MACIIFTSFECLRRNVDEALSHITAGINIFKSWRENSGRGPNGPWGQRYPSFESSFVETELAPMLSCLNLASSECSRRPFLDVFLNPVNLDGSLILGESFETVSEARVGLMDLLTAGIRLTQGITAESAFHGEKPIVEALIESGWLSSTLQSWKTAWDNLVRRHQEVWGKEEKSAADFVRLMWHCANIESHTWISGTETAWDPYKAEYEEMIRLAESLLSDPHYFPDEPCRRISADLGMIFPLQVVAWKCRWPLLRRRALALLLQTSKRECLLDADHYHTIFSRIMEYEERYLCLPPGAVPNEDTLPPEHVRVHHFYIAAQPASVLGGNLYAATFLTKPNGLDNEWHCQTEYLDLSVGRVSEAAMISALLPGYKSIGCEFGRP
ncbi:uncharacterized protein N7498_007320 [Penicillium cinerascens]|uniref:Uncharacterized protein n=1 Tax=Penicillium cinerascens TaxID=70096 RepID=A0A9W9MDR6_9EURO|nr:uncharacterized protein N7498_007320 [Penicillium cinerascens]KAJ5198203.1 hypothetical protein N7498_007320 [Penicillium cinerascens]